MNMLENPLLPRIDLPSHCIYFILAISLFLLLLLISRNGDFLEIIINTIDFVLLKDASCIWNGYFNSPIQDIQHDESILIVCNTHQVFIVLLEINSLVKDIVLPEL